MSNVFVGLLESRAAGNSFRGYCRDERVFMASRRLYQRVWKTKSCPGRLFDWQTTTLSKAHQIFLGLFRASSQMAQERPRAACAIEIKGKEKCASICDTFPILPA